MTEAKEARTPGVELDPHELGIGRLFNAIRDAVVVADDEGRIVLWNAGAIAMFGYTLSEALEMNVDQLVPPEYKKAHNAGMRRYRETGHGPMLDARTALEVPALRKNGDEIVVELLLSPLEFDGARYALALLRDVTERARMRDDIERRSKQLEDANRALRDANESLEAFTYVVGHDLKEPVRGIEAYLRALREDYGGGLPPDALEILDRAQAATRRMGELLRGLLEFSRISHGQLTLERIWVEDILEAPSCRTTFEHLIEERGGTLEVAGDIPALHASHPVMCQVFSNLITNALKHNDSPAPLVRVRGARLDGDKVEIVVEDNGPGFPPRMRERFNARALGPAAAAAAVPTPSARGGFGLLIAARAAERSQGSMRLGVSKDLGGAAVHLVFPVAPSGPATAGADEDDVSTNLM